MDCDAAREMLMSDLRGRLSDREHAELEAHLATCEACRRAREVERVTDDLIARIPRFAAPVALKRELRRRHVGSAGASAAASATAAAASASAAAPASARLVPRGAGRSSAWTGALVALVLFAIALTVSRLAPSRAESQKRAALETELVNDHLRVLYAEHPLDVVSTGIHDVKPWFAGKLDFAPPVSYAGDADYPLQGGSVAYVLDRRAADFVFKRRLHTVSLFVLPSSGLAWPDGDVAIGARVKANVQTQRGFHVVAWRDGEMAYALVSDLNVDELKELAKRVAGD